MDGSWEVESMMSVYFSPIVGLDEIMYEFSGDSVTATIGEVSDTFDFTGMPDGSIDIMSVETTLPFNPLIQVERVEGVLFVELINPIPYDATEFQRFPEWIEVGEENGEVQMEV